jgi:DNA-directed RNA polymerase subunit beta'
MFHTSGVFIGGTVEHVQAPSNRKTKFIKGLVHPTRTCHEHLVFLYSMNLYVIIESHDIIHNMTIPSKSFFFSSKRLICRIRTSNC